MNFFRKHKAELNYILFEVTQQCNLNCSYCYNHWKREKGEPENQSTSYSAALKTLKQLFKTTNIKHVTFTGGEPLLQERLKELVLFCRMKGASVSLITNGNAGTPEDISQLISVGVQLFELPMHSNSPAVHDRMTGMRGSWEKSNEKIRYISKLGGYLVPVIVVTKHNYNTVSLTLQMLKEMGFSRIMLNRYNIGGQGVMNPEKVIPTKEQLNEAFRQANEAAQKMKLEISSNVCTPHCVVDPNLYRNIAFTNCSMDIARRPLTLTATGDLRFCNHSPSVMGNIFEQPVANILYNNSKIGIIDQPPTFCNGCLKYEKCLGGCRAAAEQVGKGFCEVDPIVEINQLSETKSA